MALRTSWHEFRETAIPSSGDARRGVPTPGQPLPIKLLGAINAHISSQSTVAAAKLAINAATHGMGSHPLVRRGAGDVAGTGVAAHVGMPSSSGQFSDTVQIALPLWHL